MRQFGLLPLIFLAILEGPAQAQPGSEADRLLATSSPVDVRDGETLAPRSWTLDPSLNPDTYAVELAPGERREVCFISENRSLCRTVGMGEQADFVIVMNGVEHPTRIASIPPAATFDAAYQDQNQGRIQVLVPEVYELVNIAIALTPYAQQNSGTIYTQTPYHSEMMQHFGAFADHPLISALNTELERDYFNYHHLKMNGYSFEFNDDGEIVRSSVYDRTGFRGFPINHLAPMQALLQSFAEESGFRGFYAAHGPFYDEQITYIVREIDIEGGLAWLRGHFPNVQPYDSTKVIFSPLVFGHQSLTTFENNGFREIQPHTNFPYPSTGDASLAPRSVALQRGGIIFGELNHGFINPEADAYGDEIRAAVSNRTFWARAGTSSDSYGNEQSLFLEMMNWALLSLYYNDLADPADRERLIDQLNPYMDTVRGFPQFPAFNRFLVDLYRNRPPGTTIADLYPQIIAWFAEHQRAAPSPA